ncbi:MAG: recombinase family protein [Actinomycetota bacterium]|nr:recombinase family protein [Actinomycetota bacterium]
MSDTRPAGSSITKAAGYVRVSSRQQLDGYGLDVQQLAITKYAKEHRLKLVEVFREEGVSGTLPVTERPALMGALELMTACKADVLLVPNLDRLARELHVQEAALGLLWDAGKAVHTVEDGEVRQDDPDDPMRKAMRKMRGVLAELDKDTVVMRLRKGKQAKRAEGGFIGGQVPFGYRAEGGRLVADASEQEVIAKIHEMHRNGESLRGIAARLQAESVSTRSGGEWHPTQVARILGRARGSS